MIPKRVVFSLVLILIATWGLLVIGKWIVPLIPGSWSSVDVVDYQLKYQLTSALFASAVLLILRALRPAQFAAYARRGNIQAAAEANRVFGITAGESWKKVGITLSILITAVTAVVIWGQVVNGQKLQPVAWLLLWVPIFAAVNAAVEEGLTRFGVVVALEGAMTAPRIAIVSGLIFGTVHYFGTPGGFVGVLVAGILGWVLARSVLETRGIFWAWWVHFLQDLVILSALLLTA